MKVKIPANYRYIPSFPDYCVEKFGNTIIKVYEDGSTHVVIPNRRGYVTVFRDGKRYCRSPYQLMKEAWFGEMLPNGKYTIPVMALNIAKESIKWIHFKSMSEASKKTGVPVKYISEIINEDGHLSAYGWAFRREDGMRV